MNATIDICVDELRIDTRARMAWIGTTSIGTTSIEFDLLVCLARSPTAVVTKANAMRDVYHVERPWSTRTMDSHACRLREKIRRAGGGSMVQSVWGIGYRLVDPVPA